MQLKNTAAALLAALLLLTTGCFGGKKIVNGKSNEDPRGKQSGMYGAGQSLIGGHEDEGINLKDISIANDVGECIVTLTFCRGSEEEGTEEKPADRVPVYRVDHPEGLCRFMLTLEGVEYWDYRVYPEEIENSPVMALFRGGSSAEGKNMLVFNLSEDCDFRTEEEGGALRIIFKPNGAPEDSHWYVTVDGYDLYPGNESIDTIHSMGFYPTLCSDGNSILLVSAGFDTRDEAQSYLAEYEQTLNRVLPGRVCSLLEIIGCEAPEYSVETQITNLINAPVGTLDGKEIEAAVLQTAGRFLCWSPVKEGDYVYARTCYEMDDGGMISYEELWLHSETERQILPGGQFTSLLSAEFSSDGNWLAVLEQTAQMNRTLEIIHLEDDTFVLISDFGGGIDTPSMVWDSAAPLLYCQTGEGEELWFTAVDMSGTDPVVKKIAEAGHESEIALTDGKLCFITEDENGKTYFSTMPVKGGEITEITEALAFQVNPLGKLAAVLTSGDSGESIRILDIAEGTAETVSEGGIVIDLQWDVGGEILYYTLYDAEAVNEDQPLLLYRAGLDSEPKLLMNMIPGTMYPAARTGKALLVYLFTQVNQTISMTYELNLK